MENLKEIQLSDSIVERVINLVRKSPNIDVFEATKQAIREEQKFISELIDQQTDRSKQALTVLRKNTYAIIHILK
jgi:hypothetical protein